MDYFTFPIMPETTNAKPNSYFQLLPPETMEHIRSFLTRASDSISLDQSLSTPTSFGPSQEELDQARKDQEEMDAEETHFWEGLEEIDDELYLVYDDLYPVYDEFEYVDTYPDWM